MIRCYFCRGELESAGRTLRTDTCPSCGRELHACVQCRFHDPAFHNQCREPKADMVRDREKSNHCGYFELGGGQGDGRASERDAAKKSLEDLFKKKG